MGVVPANGQHVVLLTQFLNPPFTTQHETFIPKAIPELDAANGMGGFCLEVFGLPVAATENELFQVAHLLMGVSGKAGGFRHFQDLRNPDGRLVIQPVSAAVSQTRQITRRT